MAWKHLACCATTGIRSMTVEQAFVPRSQKSTETWEFDYTR